MRKIVAALAAALLLTGVSFVPAQAAVLPAPAFLWASTYADDTEECQVAKLESKPKCFNIGFTAIREYESYDMPESRGKSGSASMTLIHLKSGKKFELRSTADIEHYFDDFGPAWATNWGTIEASKLPAIKSPYDEYELTATVNFPKGSVCDYQGWCEEVPAISDTRVFRFKIKNDMDPINESYKATVTQKATKTASVNSEKSATYTGKASYKATETATYKYKGKTYKATASHTVTKSKKVTKKAKATAKSTATKSATKTAVSSKSAKDAKLLAANAASKQASKDAIAAATKAAKKSADKKASAEAKKKLTKKSKSKAKADAQKQITKKVKADAKKEAKKKALSAAKKKAKK